MTRRHARPHPTTPALPLACVLVLAAGCAAPPPATAPPTSQEAAAPRQERPEIRVALASSAGGSDASRARAVCDAVLQSSPNQDARRQLADADPDALCAEILVVAAKAEYGPPDELIPLALALAPWSPRARLAEIDLVEAFVQTVEADARPAASWCLSDRYRRLAASVEDPAVSATAREKADRYGAVRRAPSAGAAPRRGALVTVDLGKFGTCQTPAR